MKSDIANNFEIKVKNINEERHVSAVLLTLRPAMRSAINRFCF